MRKSSILIFFILVLFISVFYQSRAMYSVYAMNSYSTPYWLKTGTVIEYYANATQNTTWGGTAQYSPHAGCIYAIDFQQVFLKFSFVNVSEKWAYVKVTAEFLGSNIARGVFSNVNVVYPPSCKPLPGPLINTSTFTPNGKLMKDSLYKNLTITGEYKLSLTNGSVYSLNGTYYGHTLLFGLYPSEKNSLEAMLAGKKLLPENLVSLNITYITYFKNYTGPNILVKYPQATIATPTGENATTRIVAVFNPADDITLGMMGSIPDLEAIGINLLIALDNMVQKFNQELSESGSSPASLGKYPAPGVMLYSLQVPKTKTETIARPVNNEIQAKAIPAKPKSSSWPIIIAIVGAAVLIGAVLARRGK